MSQPDHVNVLIGNADWAWPQAVAEIFQPRGINTLIANTPAEMVHIIDNNRIHLAILDMTIGQSDLSGMHTMKMIRKHNILLPCIMLAHNIDRHLLDEALKLDVFSVLSKPVDIDLLKKNINRLFLKCYECNVFADDSNQCQINTNINITTKSFAFKWTIRKKK